MENFNPTGPGANAWAPPLVVPPRRPVWSRPAFNFGLFAITFVSTTVAGAYLAHFDYDLVRLWIMIKWHPEWLAGWMFDGLYFSVPLMAILGSHELGHYLVARHYRVASSLPYFLPAPNLVGTFGAVIVMKGKVPSRKALFDIGAAGPLMGLAVTLFTFFLGLRYAEVMPLMLPRGGVMFGPNLLMTAVFELAGGLPDNAMIVSPLIDAACVGFLVTALNLFPLGQLDGGHVAHAVFGRHSLAIGIGSLGVMAVLGIVFWPAWLAMGVIFFLFMGRKGLRHPPPEDEETPLGAGRCVVAAVILIAMVLILAPVPVGIMGIF